MEQELMQQFSRPLVTDQAVRPFVENILAITGREEKREAINAICAAELGMSEYLDHSTMHNDAYRDFEYSTFQVREELRKQVFYELITYERPQSDDNIRLGSGGALPKSGPAQEEGKAYIIIGSPASGKSSISNRLADNTFSIIIDSDYAKRKLPEYYNKKGGATLVHEESYALTFNYEPFNLLEYSVENKYNIVIPKIGNNINSLMELIKAIKDRGYKVALILIDLDRQKATQRAYKRFLETERYVPLSLIFDTYANDPILNYYRIKQQYPDYFFGFAQISTDVAFGQNPIIIETVGLDEIHGLYL